MKEKIELKPCPFCGGEVHVEKLYQYDGYQGEVPLYVIRHAECQVHIGGRAWCEVSMASYNEAEAIEMWNRRTAVN